MMNAAGGGAFAARPPSARDDYRRRHHYAINPLHQTYSFRISSSFDIHRYLLAAKWLRIRNTI